MDEELRFHLDRLTIAFGAVALILAAMGTDGTVAHDVARRTEAIGIRSCSAARYSR